MCRRSASRFDSSRLVEIAPERSPAKLTMTLEHKVKFFCNHLNQLEPTNPNQLMQSNQSKSNNQTKQPISTKPNPN